MNWNHVNGGAVGYLHRCQETLRFAGVRLDDEMEARRVLGDNTYENMVIAGEWVRYNLYSPQDDRPEQTL